MRANRTINDLTLSAGVLRTTRARARHGRLWRPGRAALYSQRMPALSGTVPSTK